MSSVKKFREKMNNSRAVSLLLTFRGAWALIFACWLPAFLASWPGIFVIDNVFQMKWYLEGNISAHHPVLHTYLLGGILTFGKRVFGSYEAGLCLFSLLQMLFLSAVFAGTVKLLGRHAGRISALAALLFYAVMPYHPVSAFTATKDTVFAGLFLLMVAADYLIAGNQEAFFSSRKRMILYGVLVFAMCAFRNTGIYIFIFSLPAFLILCRKYWKRAAAVALCCILAWGIFTGPVCHLLGIEKGSSAEILSVPIQQLSRAMMNAPEEFTEEQWETAAEYMPDYARYQSRVSDPVKDTFNAELFEKDPGQFIRLWWQMFLKCPVIYMEAFLSTNIGFWNPFMQYPDPGTYLAYIPYHSADPEQVGVSWEGQVFVGRHSFIPGLDTVYEKLTESGGYNRIPGAGLLYSAATAFLLTAAALVYCIVKKRWETMPSFFLLIGLWGTLMLSPVVAFRYGYPLIISIPVVWMMCVQKSSVS